MSARRRRRSHRSCSPGPRSSALGADVLAGRSIGPVIHKVEQPQRAWSSSEDAVMAWAVHFWGVDRRTTKFPYVFEQFYFQRWITAYRLRHKMPPALTVTQEKPR